jgi:hypothetical protein
MWPWSAALIAGGLDWEVDMGKVKIAKTLGVGVSVVQRLTA